MPNETQMLERVSAVFDPPAANTPAPKQPEPANEPTNLLDAEEIELTDVPDDEEPDESQPEGQPAPDLVELEIAGEVKQLTKAELKAIAEEHGTLKQSAEGLKAAREAIEQERHATHQIRSLAPAVESIRAEGRYLAQAMQGLDQEIQSLRESDPVAAFQKREQFNQLAQRFQQLGQQEGQMADQLRMLEVQQLEAAIKAEIPALFEKLPQWKNPEKRKSDQAFIREYMKREGYSEQEANLATKSHYIATLLKAAKYDQIRSTQASKKVNTAPPMARPGATSTPGLQNAVAQSEYRKAIRKAPDERTAAKLIQKELERRLK